MKRGEERIVQTIEYRLISQASLKDKCVFPEKRILCSNTLGTTTNSGILKVKGAEEKSKVY